MSDPGDPLPARRSLLWIALVAVGLASTGAVLWRGSLVVRSEGNRELPDLPFRFRHEDLDHPILARLRTEERLEDVVAPGRDRVERAVRLCHWTHGQIPPGTPIEYPPWDATVILQWVRDGLTDGFCAQYAQVFAQACLSLGWRPRYVEIGPVSNPIAHFSTEVWIDPLAKWVHLDPTHDVRYESAGRLLSSLEVHRALVEGRLEEVAVRRGLAGTLVEGEERERLLADFYYLRFGLKMDHLSDPSDRFDRALHYVDWNDPETVPWESSEVEAPAEAPHMATAGHDVDDPELFDFPLNRVHVESEADRFRGRVRLCPRTDMAGFDHYLVRVGDLGRRPLEGEFLEIEVGEEPVEVEFVAVNSRGVEGVPARLVLSWWGK